MTLYTFQKLKFLLNKHYYFHFTSQETEAAPNSLEDYSCVLFYNLVFSLSQLLPDFPQISEVFQGQSLFL